MATKAKAKPAMTSYEVGYALVRFTTNFAVFEAPNPKNPKRGFTQYVPLDVFTELGEPNDIKVTVTV